MDREDPPPPPLRPDRDAQLLDGVRSALGTDFEVLRKLGEGSMARVYLARERALGRLVAVKVLRPGLAGDETARLRFEREARAAASLVHPNVVQVHRFGRLPDQTPYLVMHFVKGRTMEDRLKAEGRLAPPVARDVLHDVASALAAAHAHGIAHRDVRPANILWDEDDESAHLADFGIAAIHVGDGDQPTRITKSGQLIGEPRYLSPEQLTDQRITTAVDMYAFGVLGYELYTGRGPYDAKNNRQLISAHLSSQPRDLATDRPDMDPAVADLLKRCLNREPNHRPTATDAARILRGSTSISGRRNGADGGEIDELIRRRVPQIVVISATAGLSLIGLVGELVDRDRVGPLAFDLTLPLVVCGFLASVIIGWFHGERGRQHVNVLEWTLLGIVAVAWLAISAWILLAG